MIWTNGLPTAPGWYFRRWRKGRPVSVVEVAVDYRGRLVIDGLREVANYEGHQWAGPIPKPQEQPVSRHPNGILCDDPADYDDDGRAEFEYREKQMEAQKVATIGEPAELWGIWYSGSPPGWMKHGLSSAIVLFERKVDAESHNRITSSDEPHCYHVRRYHPPEPAPEPQHPLLAAIDRLAKDPDIPQQLMLELEEIAEPLCRNHEEMRTMLKRISDIKHISHYEPEIYDEIHDLLAKEPQ